MSPLNEVQFVGNVKSWIDQICQSEGEGFPFAKAAMEDYPVGKRTRKDLVLFDHKGKKVLSGEVKLPDRQDGRTPYDSQLVEDAHIKASTDGIDYFFTWNVNSFVLWQTYKPGTPLAERRVYFDDWFEYRESDHLTRPEVEEAIRARLRGFLRFFADIHTEKREFPRLAPDKFFIHVLKRALDGPQSHSRTVIHRRAEEDKKFKRDVERWVKNNLGRDFRREEFAALYDTAARFSCYIIAIKILFYDALCRRYADLPALTVPSSTNAAQLMKRLEKAFRHAEEVSGDYETVFEGDEFGNALPFLDDIVVNDWRRLINQVDDYDFTRIPYDIIGSIFEGLISPTERRRNGQHYTKSEIVDLVNAFCIRKSTDVVIDPACGGGTFLVRAYARKQWLERIEHKKRNHEDRIAEIYGADISIYPAHLTVVSLATRDLKSDANYPRIACDDFFDLRKGVKAFPAGVERKGKLTSVKTAAVARVDAVVGNPPYVRQEFIETANKKKYVGTVAQEWNGLKFSGRSDLHVYFWPHASSFLPDDSGYFGFLTSSSWLDVEYGFTLQRWILENFCIEAILESSAEPWFTDARVATAVTILRREPDLKKRINNLVRFVQIRRPLDDIYMDIQHGDDRIDAAERLRGRILDTKKNSETRDWRIRVVPQKQLIEGPDKETPSHHKGGKWGIHLRAPDIYFELMDRFGDKFVPLSEIAEIRRGITSGCDSFFFPRDITEEVKAKLSDAQFRSRWGFSRKETNKYRICRAGDGTDHVIEAKYLEPEVHSLMEIDSPVVDPEKLARKIMLVSAPKSELKGTYVLKYIKYGETHTMGSDKQGTDKVPVNQKVTVKARESENRAWYDLSSSFRGDLFWPMAQKYRHVVPTNPERLICNHNLFDLQPKEDIDSHVLAAILNSSIVALSKSQFGRWAGTEATLKTEVIDVNMMLVPDPRTLSSAQKQTLKRAFSKLAKRETQWLIHEFTDDARRELDLAVLTALGCSESESVKLRDRLYNQLHEFYSVARETEKQAQKNRATVGRGDLAGAVVKDDWKISDESAFIEE